MWRILLLFSISLCCWHFHVSAQMVAWTPPVDGTYTSFSENKPQDTVTPATAPAAKQNPEVSSFFKSLPTPPAVQQEKRAQRFLKLTPQTEPFLLPKDPKKNFEPSSYCPAGVLQDPA